MEADDAGKKISHATGRGGDMMLTLRCSVRTSAAAALFALSNLALAQSCPSGTNQDGNPYGCDGASFAAAGNQTTYSAPVTLTDTTSSNDTYGNYGNQWYWVGGNGAFLTGKGASSSNGATSGHGGAARGADTQVARGGDVTITLNNPTHMDHLWSGLFDNNTVDNWIAGGDAAVLIGGSGGNGGADYVRGGDGGEAGDSDTGYFSIHVTDAGVISNGTANGVPGVLLYGLGGNGGQGATDNNGQQVNDSSCAVCAKISGVIDSSGGNGGSVLGDSVTVTAVNQSVTISTTGTASPAIADYHGGGAGGNGGLYEGATHGEQAGAGGNGGAGGAENITLTGSGGSTDKCLNGGASGSPVCLKTSGAHSAGIYAISWGGTAGNGGKESSTYHEGGGGSGGAGGSGGDIKIALNTTYIGTQGANSAGIVAISQGDNGGTGGIGDSGQSNGGAGGHGGDGGAVTVMLDAASSITTAGADSSGVIAESFSGAGGVGGTAAAFGKAVGGNGGTGGQAGAVSVGNSGTITTAGDHAYGILAQSIAGNGGQGGAAGALVSAHGGSGGATDSPGNVTITDIGRITTAGAGATGILAQAIGGSGGAGGSADAIAAFGGTGGSAPFTSNGGQVSINSGADGNPSQIATSGVSAIGITAQSIGGGGGSGGGGNAILGVGIGGSGGGGGGGGAVRTDLQGTTIGTSGDSAFGIVAQSVGGGGGNAGQGRATGVEFDLAIGGTGGGGGNGGQVNVDSQNTSITTLGSNAIGLIAQSIGGGGGTGGSASSSGIGLGLDVSVALGGNGGGAGNGNNAEATLTHGTILTGADPLLVNGTLAAGQISGSGCTKLPCNTLPVDAYGVVVQSIGGGGGAGGSASAKALSLAVPVDENQSVSAAFSLGVGGNGVSGGDGANAQLSLSNGSSITTYGHGSTGAIVQSIGGGGGAGGDSSASAEALGPIYVPDSDDTPKFLTTSYNIAVSVALGGSAGNGGNGGETDVALGGTVNAAHVMTADASGSAPAFVVTHGDYANGVMAQSIGGGGGNAGFGSGTTQEFGSGSDYSLTFDLGGKAGNGGYGGPVQVELFPNSRIETFGSEAFGLIAQSIGGGGGTAQGMGLSFGIPTQGTNWSETNNLNVGMKGGGGGDSGSVTVTLDGASITTGAAAMTASGGYNPNCAACGGASIGVLAQSIGGGGGVGGSAGADASADTVMQFVQNVQQAQNYIATFLNDMKDENIPETDTNTLSIGGKGGTGGNAGSVIVNVGAINADQNQAGQCGNQLACGSVTTFGDWADGIVAQSIGGGGGLGGAAVATGSGGAPSFTENDVFGVGGTGGNGGNGSTATVNLVAGQIDTYGFGAAGVVVQSIGGGGGMGGDGSDSATGVYTVGGAIGGNGGTSGSGGKITVTAENFNINTSGAAADGIDMQSIAGGGGRAGAGSHFFVATFKNAAKTNQLSAGGGLSNNGGSVYFTSGSQDTNGVQITTQGNDAIGVLAQSIGGGGGNVISQPSAGTTVNYLGGGLGAGGTVTFDLRYDGADAILTSGVAAHGIVAQSIGGGGGVIRTVHAAGDTPVLTDQMTGVQVTTKNFATYAPPSDGGAVSVYANVEYGAIKVTGAGAVGILAQSIGGGGGLVNNINGQIEAGTVGGNGSGGQVLVDTKGAILATGANGIGVFAQSTGSSSNGGVQINVQTADSGAFTDNLGIMGGSGPGATPNQAGSAAIVVDTPAKTAGNQVTISSGNAVTTQCYLSGGSDCTAILASGGGALDVTNNATLQGATYLAGGSLQNFGSFSGAEVDGNLINNGMVTVGASGTGARVPQATTVTGNFIQTPGGRLDVAVDSLGKSASRLVVDGDAVIAGRVVPTAISLLPGTLPVVTAGGTLNLDPSLIAAPTTLFDWGLARSGNSITLSPTLNAKPAGLALTADEASLAGYLTRLWSNSEARFATEFAALSRLNGVGQYKAVLDTLAGKSLFTQSKAFVGSSNTMLGSSLSCPIFIDRGTRLGEDNCFWAKVTGNHASQWGEADAGDSQVNGVTTRIGAQKEIDPGWYLGGSFGAAQEWSRSGNGGSGSGQTYDGSVALKHTVGPWLFAGSVAVGSGSFESNRTIDLPFMSLSLQGSPHVFFAGTRLRVGYEFGFDQWYVRPYGDLDVMYTHIPGFRESSGAINAIDISGGDKTSLAFSPMVEVGGRWDFSNKITLRPFAQIGATFRPNSTYTFDASFAGASSASGTFRESFKLPSAQANLNLGLQLYNAHGLDIKAEYMLEVGRSFRNQGGSLRIAQSF